MTAYEAAIVFPLWIGAAALVANTVLSMLEHRNIAVDRARYKDQDDRNDEEYKEQKVIDKEKYEEAKSLERQRTKLIAAGMAVDPDDFKEEYAPVISLAQPPDGTRVVDDAETLSDCLIDPV